MTLPTGFEHDIEHNDGTVLCLKLKGHFSDEVQAEFGHSDPYDWEHIEHLINEVRRRESEVYSHITPCPLMNTCKRYQRSSKALRPIQPKLF
jgi:hypothetical protein